MYSKIHFVAAYDVKTGRNYGNQSGMNTPDGVHLIFTPMQARHMWLLMDSNTGEDMI